jgi:hypothetical protein
MSLNTQQMIKTGPNPNGLADRTLSTGNTFIPAEYNNPQNGTKLYYDGGIINHEKSDNGNTYTYNKYNNEPNRLYNT